MRPVKFTKSATATTWNDGYLHAFVPRMGGGVDAVVEFVKSGKVVSIPVDDEHLRFDPTTEILVEQQAKTQERQERMMAAMSGQAGGNILVPR